MTKPLPLHKSRQTAPKKILITGVESSGKSTLCGALANYYQTLWVNEYAREYLEIHGANYVESDLLIIAKEQFLRQNYASAKTENYLFCDTGLEVLQVWSEVKYGSCDSWISEHMSKQNFDLVLLCGNDIPWEYDKLREMPDPSERAQLLERYKEFLIAHYGGYTLVRGNSEERLSQVAFLLQSMDAQ
jgi:NadR type nicotinamide-nucleotide adenylyltransferase